MGSTKDVVVVSREKSADGFRSDITNLLSVFNEDIRLTFNSESRAVLEVPEYLVEKLDRNIEKIRYIQRDKEREFGEQRLMLVDKEAFRLAVPSFRGIASKADDTLLAEIKQLCNYWKKSDEENVFILMLEMGNIPALRNLVCSASNAIVLKRDTSLGHFDTFMVGPTRGIDTKLYYLALNSIHEVMRQDKVAGQKHIRNLSFFSTDRALVLEQLFNSPHIQTIPE